LVNLSIGTSSVDVGMVKHQFIVHVLTQRSFTKSQSLDRFYKNDNKIDNLDLTSDIIIKAITNLKLQNNTADIELNEPTLEAIKFDFMNVLDGYSCTIELAVINTDDVCSY
jgi:formyltetrahydrofolate synthetase